MRHLDYPSTVILSKPAMSAWGRRSILGQTTMGEAEREEIAAKINVGRARMKDILDYVEALPQPAKSQPFGALQDRYDTVLDIAYESSETVRAISERLAPEAAPWSALTDEEVGALSSWSNAIEELYDIYLRTKPDEYAVARRAGALAAAGVLYTLLLV